jgi:tetratricopeptide (TPR) repeat protein
MAAKRKEVILLAVVAALLSLLAIPSYSQTESKGDSITWALIVGVSKYPRLPGGQQLQFADRDASELALAVRRAGIPSENVRLLSGSQATLVAVKSAIGNWLARVASENDTVLIFFSGHGLIEKPYGESYLLCHDSSDNDPFASALSMTDLTVALTRRLRARKVLIIADAVRRDFFPTEEDGPAASTAFTESFGKLAAARPGLSVMLASGPGEFSREGQRWGGQGVLSRFLLDGLEGKADANGDGAITFDELFAFASQHVAEDTSNKQHPWRAQSQVSQIVLGRSQIIAQAARHVTPNRLPEPVREPRPSQPATGNPQPSPSATAPPKAETKPSQPAPVETKPPQPSKTETKPPQPAPVESKPSQPAQPRPSESVARKTPMSEPARPSAAPVEKAEAKSEKASKPAAEKPAVTAPRPVAPPRAASVNPKPAETSAPMPETKAGVEPIALPPPPKPVVRPPEAGKVTAAPTPANQPPIVSASAPVAAVGAAPSPLVLQMEAAMASGALIEPRANSAWDIYQRLAADPAAGTEAARLRPKLADALLRAGQEIIAGDVRADNISDKVDEFKRAGQLFARARALTPADSSLSAFEKISAAEALLALQFYDEAERSLASLQDLRIAGVENALGLVYQGKFDGYRAERAFKRAIEIDNLWAAPHYNLALLYRSQKNDAALEEFTLAAQLAPASAVFLAALGDEFFNREMWQKAADAFLRASELKPDDDSIFTRLGHALFSLGKREEADLAYKKANEIRRRQ